MGPCPPPQKKKQIGKITEEKDRNKKYIVWGSFIKSAKIDGVAEERV